MAAASLRATWFEFAQAIVALADGRLGLWRAQAADRRLWLPEVNGPITEELRQSAHAANEKGASSPDIVRHP
jgi:hypothetical protein